MRHKNLLILTSILVLSCKPNKNDKGSGKDTGVMDLKGVSPLANFEISGTSIVNGEKVKSAPRKGSAALFDLDSAHVGLLLPAPYLLYPVTSQKDVNYVPFMADLSINLFVPEQEQPIAQLDNLVADNQGKIARGIKVFAVGFSLRRVTGDSLITKFIFSNLGDALVKKLEGKFLSSASLKIGDNELRNSQTAFVMLALPKNLLAAQAKDLKFPKLVPSDSRPLEADLDKKIDAGGSLLVARNSNSKQSTELLRVNVLNAEGSEITPLFSLTRGDEGVRRQLWELHSDTYCLDADLGAPVLWKESAQADFQLLGFVSKSARADKQFTEEKDCRSSDATAKYGTLVVSVAKQHHDALNQLIQEQP